MLPLKKPISRAQLALSHSQTAALLCLVAIAFHLAMNPRSQVKAIFYVELALAAYGIIAGLLVGKAKRLARSDRVKLGLCWTIYLLTIAWIFLVPSIN